MLLPVDYYGIQMYTFAMTKEKKVQKVCPDGLTVVELMQRAGEAYRRKQQKAVFPAAAPDKSPALSFGFSSHLEIEVFLNGAIALFSSSFYDALEGDATEFRELDSKVSHFEANRPENLVGNERPRLEEITMAHLGIHYDDLALIKLAVRECLTQRIAQAGGRVDGENPDQAVVFALEEIGARYHLPPARDLSPQNPKSYRDGLGDFFTLVTGRKPPSK